MAISGEHIEGSSSSHYYGHKKHKCLHAAEEEPLVDTTATLTLNSKKTQRRRKRVQEKTSKHSQDNTSILQLPPELLLQVLGELEPLDILRLGQVDHNLRDFIYEHESIITKDIIRHRYRTLSRCFPLPILLAKVNASAHPALLDPSRQKMLVIHKKPYQHIPVIDQDEFCTCMSCIFAWNNLCLVLDFAHWQKNLDDREPIPMISRGDTPEWNTKLLARNAAVVQTAVGSPIVFAMILQQHLESTTRTILRRSKWSKKPAAASKRTYHLSEAEAETGIDAYLERSGPPSYEFPYHRDNYYSLEAYVPNRRWSDGRWVYYIAGQHDRDVELTVSYFSKTTTSVNGPSHKPLLPG